MRDLAGAHEDVALAQPHKVIKLRDPILHIHQPAIERLEFGKVEVSVS